MTREEAVNAMSNGIKKGRAKKSKIILSVVTDRRLFWADEFGLDYVGG